MIRKILIIYYSLYMIVIHVFLFATMCKQDTRSYNIITYKIIYIKIYCRYYDLKLKLKQKILKLKPKLKLKL